jgi:hypothetical protein
MYADGKNVSGNAQGKATTPQHEVVQFLTASVGVEKPFLATPLLVSGLDVEIHTVTSSL